MSRIEEDLTVKNLYVTNDLTINGNFTTLNRTSVDVEFIAGLDEHLRKCLNPFLASFKNEIDARLKKIEDKLEQLWYMPGSIGYEDAKSDFEKIRNDFVNKI